MKFFDCRFQMISNVSTSVV